MLIDSIRTRLYIFWSLHQTTTMSKVTTQSGRLYIFWSLHQTTTQTQQQQQWLRCISFDPYIKPQHEWKQKENFAVVYLLIPTSNHNRQPEAWNCCVLYIFWSLHQTTTAPSSRCSCPWLYIFWSLHQTTTCYFFSKKVYELYIFWSLHQTTTPYIYYIVCYGCISFDPYIKPQLWGSRYSRLGSCISFDPYIKPQPICFHVKDCFVVYLLIPTSNHNNTPLYTYIV